MLHTKKQQWYFLQFAPAYDDSFSIAVTARFTETILDLQIGE